MGNGLTLGNIGRIAYEFGCLRTNRTIGRANLKTIRRIFLTLNPYFLNEIYTLRCVSLDPSHTTCTLDANKRIQ